MEFTVSEANWARLNSAKNLVVEARDLLGRQMDVHTDRTLAKAELIMRDVLSFVESEAYKKLKQEQEAQK